MISNHVWRDFTQVTGAVNVVQLRTTVIFETQLLHIIAMTTLAIRIDGFCHT
jgi:hypothetical protein